MVDLASHPSRRTVVKAGLWAAPALAVVNLTAMSAAHASTVVTPPCTTTYTSHAFVVFLVDGVYYSIKFGEDGHFTAPGDDGNSFDQAFLRATLPPNSTIIFKGKDGNAAQQNIYAGLLAALMVTTFSNTSGEGYIITSAPSSIDSVYAYDGSFKTPTNIYGVHPIQLTGGQILISKCV